MSAEGIIRRVTAPEIKLRKGGGAPIVSLTAYVASVAALVDPHVDFILVGDSLGMVVHGYDSTVPVPLDLMILHAKAVMRGSKRALVVVDMPFGTYEESSGVAFRNAVQVMKETGCGAVKLEGGVTMAPTIRFLVERGIPVMAHIGLTPQHVNTLGGFKAQGRRREQWGALEADATAVADAGAFAVVLEAMPAELADQITAAVAIPTIGIGASAGCDGQILVIDDMLGMFARLPKFVKRFGRVGEEITAAVSAFADEVRARTFPAPEHTYGVQESPGPSAPTTEPPKKTKAKA